MRKLYILAFVTGLFVWLTLLPTQQVTAATEKLEDLKIHVYIHEDGSATITEKRIAEINEGTENYIIIGNLGKSTIENFTVKENGKTYDFIENWDIDASREAKAFKNGIVEEKDHYELAWGIGDYGRHAYELQYTVTDFIKQLEDAQVLFWRFVNDQLNTPPENVEVEVEAAEAISNENEKIWGFGFEGDIHFNNGKVIATNAAPLTEKNYVTVLIQFEEDRFQTNDILEQTFEEIQEQAFAGSDYESKNKSIFSTVMTILMVVFFVLVLPLILIPIVIFFVLPHFKRAKERKQFREQFADRYYREVPYEGPFHNVYMLLNDIRVASFEQLLSTFILKWLYEGLIEVTSEEKGLVVKSHEATIYVSSDGKEHIADALEKRLYLFFFRAADKNGKVSQRRFAKWVEKNRSKINKWERDVEHHSKQYLRENGLTTIKEVGIFKMKLQETTAAGKELEGNIYMFMNYLKDFSLMNEHEPANVKIWDGLMIWASLLGITDEVYKQFNKLYPQYQTESIYTPSVILSIHSYSTSVQSAKSYASSASGGAGGSTSTGGGGGSFGGGSGGGTR